MPPRRSAAQARVDRLVTAAARSLHPWRVTGRDGQARERTLPVRWRHADQPVWFEHTVELSDDLRGRTLVLHLDVAEGLLWLDGRPCQGLDRHHQDVVLTPPLTNAPRLELAIEASRAAPFGGAWFREAWIGEFDPLAQRLSHGRRTAEALRGVLPSGGGRDAIDAALDEVDALVRADSPSARQEMLADAMGVLERAVGGTSHGASRRGLLHLVGHSHIDVVWLWTLAETRRKCARTFSTTLRLMERHPDFRFAASQAQLYDFVKLGYPGIYEQVRDRVREGRWEVVGSTWVEPDCNIPNGESLVRQIAYGRAFFEREFGDAGDVLWLPDTFGYAASLPQILKLSGIRSFFTTKLLWNDTTRFPHHSFWWQGIDGTRVLAHNPPVGLEGLATPADFAKAGRGHSERRRSPHVLQTYGYGDGGGGVTDEHLHAIDLLSSATGLPGVRHSSVAGFFRALHADAARLPVWRDELYLELHRGTYTTHAWLKLANRRAEAALYTADLLCALAGLAPAGEPWPDRSAELESLWKRLLLNQFHDIVPGTAIEPAYADTRRDFAAIDRGCAELREAAAARLLPPVGRSQGPARTVFNPLPWDRDVTVRLASPMPATLTDAAGTPLTTQTVRDGGGVAVLCAVKVPALGRATLLAAALQPPRPRRLVRSRAPDVLDGPHVRLHFDSTGAIASLIDKSIGREVAIAGRRLNEFQAFRDEPRHWEAWDIDPDYESKTVNLFGPATIRIVERGPLRWRARVAWGGRSPTCIEQDVLLHHDSARVDFVTRVAWHERRTLLKVAFPLALRADRATYEIPFGAIVRPTRARSRRARARWEVPGQQWADLSEPGYGVSLLNDSKYGYDCRETTLRLTLIRSPRYPHHAEPMSKTARRCTDQGEHRFTYALLPHAGTWREAHTVRRARELNVPVVVLDGARELRVPPLLRLASPNIQVSAIAPATDPGGVLVRLFEAHGVGGPARIHLGVPCDAVREVDLNQRPVRRLSPHGGTVRLSFRPFQIRTLHLTPSVAGAGRLEAPRER